MEDFLKVIISCKDEELEEIIKERIFILESSISSDSKKIFPNESKYDYSSHYIGFIKNDVKISFSMDYNQNVSYTLANYDYIFDFFRNIKKLNITKKSDAIIYLSTFLDEYFGHYNGQDQREEYLMKFGGNATIACFKGRGLAACSERAAVTNNLLEMIGLKSIYVTGSVNNELHAFNIMIDGGNRYFILDTTYNCGLYDKSGNIIGNSTYRSSLGELNENLILFLTDEKKFLFHQLVAIKQEDGTIKYQKNGQLKSYTVEPIKLDEEKVKKR